MVEHRGEDLSGSVFSDVDLTGARFDDVLLRDVVIRGAWAERLSIDGGFDELVLNGVDVVPLWHAELGRRHPEYPLLSPRTAEGCREVWPVLEEQWSATVAQAQAMPEALLHERVDGEWSFVETLRHLLFVTDAWLKRAVLADPAPYHPHDLAHSEMPASAAGVPHDPDVRPALAEVLALRAERQAVVRAYVEALTDADLEVSCEVRGPGYPEAGEYAVARCLGAVLNEEWWHRRYAERDLTVLAAR